MLVRSFLLTPLAVAGIMLPQPAQAQQGERSFEEVCQDFSWLVGTWESFSPWGQQTAPTNGTIIFSVSGQTVEGRIGRLNSDMEENGYSAGMVVFRGIGAVRSYGPTGTTRFQAWTGEYLQIDGETRQWRNEGVGVRQNGELYISPPAISRLSGHGPFRKAGGTQVNDPCSPDGEPEQLPIPAPIDQEAGLRSIVLRDDPTPPVILNPNSCPPNTSAQNPDNSVENTAFDEKLARMESKLDATYRNRGTETQTGFYADSLFWYHRGNLFEELDALVVAAMFEQSETQRAEYERRAKAIMKVLEPYTDAEIASDEAELARIESELRLLTEPTVDERGLPLGEESAPGKDGACEEDFGPILIDFDAIPHDLEKSAEDLKREAEEAEAELIRQSIAPAPDPNEIPVQSVRNDVQGLVPDLYNGDDEQERVENLASMRSALDAMDAGDPARSGLQRAYRTLYSRIEQEYSAARTLRRSEEPGSDGQRFYTDLAERLHGQLVEFQPAFDKAMADLGMTRPLTDSGLDSDSADDDWQLRKLFMEEAAMAEQFRRTPTDLAESKAGRAMQSALDRAYDSNWQYDSDLDRIVGIP